MNKLKYTANRDTENLKNREDLITVCGGQHWQR